MKTKKKKMTKDELIAELKRSGISVNKINPTMNNITKGKLKEVYNELVMPKKNDTLIPRKNFTKVQAREIAWSYIKGKIAENNLNDAIITEHALRVSTNNSQNIIQNIIKVVKSYLRIIQYINNTKSFADLQIDFYLTDHIENSSFLHYIPEINTLQITILHSVHQDMLACFDEKNLELDLEKFRYYLEYCFLAKLVEIFDEQNSLVEISETYYKYFNDKSE